MFDGENLNYEGVKHKQLKAEANQTTYHSEDIEDCLVLKNQRCC